MNLFYLIIFFILGADMGSFFTVVGTRLPKKEPFLFNHSYCDCCKEQLKLYEMVPIISYLFLRGKCHHCHQKINPLSTYMEFYTGILFATAFYIFGFSYQLLIALGIIAMLIILAVSDLSYLIIPDEILVFFSFYFLLIIFLKSGITATIFQLLSGVFLFLLMYMIMLFGNKVLKKESLGGGDIKMMFVFGLILPPLLGTMTIFLGSVLALPISLLLLIKNNEKVVPFGPFLLIAFTFVYFTGLTTEMVLSFLQF